MTESPKIAIIGLGYVGLPLAISLSKHFEVTGFDIKSSRIDELKNGFDNTNEISEKELLRTKIKFTFEPENLNNHDIFIVTVPTPITEDKKPDLSCLENASILVGKYLRKGNIVVYESTVYPGVTENICGPILEDVSELRVGKDIFLGYSPERINPGDKVHTVDKITKVVSGQTKEVSKLLAKVYGKMNGDNIFIAKNIKVAETSKVIENAQRDINIAFINEIAMITQKLGISVYDVLEASKTKWNFLNFQPGLVGGHCIGVDPYYMAECSKNVNHSPEIILSGRSINEKMSSNLASIINDKIKENGFNKNKILLLGLTFKENIPDIRNTKIIDLKNELEKYGHEVDVHDSYADKELAKEIYNLEIKTSLKNIGDYDCIVGAVPHDSYTSFTKDDFLHLLTPHGLVIDIKNIWKKNQFPENAKTWRL